MLFRLLIFKAIIVNNAIFYEKNLNFFNGTIVKI